MGTMPFRQIHLDFHTGEQINGIGKDFSKGQFQKALIAGHVNSINIFAKCHHGWLYYLNGVTPTHPGLDFDLVEEMLEACKEINVTTQIYISVGFDDVAYRKNPSWEYKSRQPKNPLDDYYKTLCFNTGYLDYLVEQIKDVVKRFDTTGIWLDIVAEKECYCLTCINQAMEEGHDPRDPKVMKELGKRVYKKYLKAVKDAVEQVNPEVKIFHNSGHIPRGRRDLVEFLSHLELESLPTGGWGYDHFPLSARYSQKFNKEMLGMTGKFHTTWAEFGGFKHPNALRYEAALNLANGAKICVGDQMHPEGLMDMVTYNLIGKAYEEVEAKEPWCDDVSNMADVALLSVESVHLGGNSREEDHADVGALRMLLEAHYLFDVIDLEDDFTQYKVIILPDKIRINHHLRELLEIYVKQGGKILATGQSGMYQEGEGFALDLGVKWLEENPYRPDYLVPQFSYLGLGSTAFLMRSKGQRVEATTGQVIGEREDSYFNRNILHKSSHFHTPNQPGKRSPGIVKTHNSIYIAWELFTDYALHGGMILRETFKNAMEELLGDKKTLQLNLGSMGITTLQHQEEMNRYIHHILYGAPVKRGSGVEVIEDITPIYDIHVELKVSDEIERVYLAPQLEEVPFVQEGDQLKYQVPKVECHQMIVLQYSKKS